MVNSYIQKLCRCFLVGMRTTAGVLVVVAWTPLHVAAANETAVQAVLVGQAYGPDFVVLQPEGADAGRALKSPSNRAPPRLRLAALHAAGAALLPLDASVRWLAPLPPLRPQRLAQQGSAEWVAKCPDVPAAGLPAVGLPAVGALPKPVPHPDFVDWFDPDFPDNCETDEGLVHYTGLAGLTAGMPVLAHTGFGELMADYSLAGNARPMSSAEKASVRKYETLWKKDFIRIYRKPFKANDEGNPYGPIRTLANAEILLVLRDKMGNAVLRVSFWDPVSPGLHLTRMLIVDHLDGSVVKRSWSFGRAQGVAG
jgi:hypothetical protein